MTSCLFCKIVNKEIPSSIIYEDKEFLSFLDISPLNKGHALVMPKQHYKTFLDLPKKELSGINLVCQKIAAGIVKATNAHGFNLIQNNNAAASQSVDHVHFHIVPRFTDDGHRFPPRGKKRYAGKEAEIMAAKIKSLL